MIVFRFQILYKEKRYMAERLREEQIAFRTSNFEKDLIKHNFKESGMDSFREFAVRILSDGYILNIDTSELHNYAYEINKIGININQIAHKVNMLDEKNPDIYLLKQNVEECLFLMNEIVKTVRRHWMS